MATSAGQFAITTTFTPPATCTQDQLTVLPSSLSFYVYLNYPNPIPETTLTDCYPSQFISSYLSQQSVTTPLAAIEPFICPVGYTEVTATPSASGYLACCPSGFQLHQQDSPIGTRPAFGGTCYSDISTVLVTAYGPDSVTATSTYTGAPGAQAYGLVMEGYATAAPTSAGSSSAATTTQGTSSTSSSATAAPSSSGSTSHAGAIAGGVVGGLAGLALVLGVVFFLYKRQRRSRNQLRTDGHKEGAYGDNDARNQHANEKKDLPDAPRAEMGGSESYPAEKDAAADAAAAAELDARPKPVHQLSELDGSETASKPSE